LSPKVEGDLRPISIPDLGDRSHCWKQTSSRSTLGVETRPRSSLHQGWRKQQLVETATLQPRHARDNDDNDDVYMYHAI